MRKVMAREQINKNDRTGLCSTERSHRITITEHSAQRSRADAGGQAGGEEGQQVRHRHRQKA